MLTWIRQFLAAPAFDDEDTTRVAGLLNAILLTILAFVTVVPPLLSLIAPTGLTLNLMTTLSLTALILILRSLMRRGHVRLTSLLISSALLVTVTLVICTFGGISNASITGYFMTIIIAGLLLGGRAAIIFGLLSIAGTLGVFLAEKNHIITVFTPTSSGLYELIAVTMTLSMTMLLLRFAVRSIAAGFERARYNENILAESNRELQAIQMMLEAHTAELSKTNEELQREIIERRRAEEASKQHAAKLEQSNRELESFAYIVSHDLQEPLRKVQIYGDRLQTKFGQALDGRGQEYLERMQHAAARMQSLIQNLLAYARVTSQTQPFEPVDLVQSTREVLSDLEMRIEQVGGRVQVGDLPTIEADPTQMRQLLQNLISNALKFHRPDEPPIVQVHSQLLKGDECVQWCQITVQDNGIGFDEKYLDRVFKAFQRLHGRGEYEGTGIGLATCCKIVERHGGAITANSTPGQGATFVVTLPVKQLEGETG